MKQKDFTERYGSGMAARSVETIGRFLRLEDGGLLFGWSNSSIRCGFEGNELSVLLSIYGDNEADYFNVLIDGLPCGILTIRKNEKRYSLASGLKYGRHTAVLIKRTEGVQTSVLFYGFDYGSSFPAPAPEPRNRIVEIIGDSISAGYGNEGEDAWSGFDLKKENASATYGVLAADALDAECYITAISGQGVCQDLSGQKNTVMPDYYRRVLVNRSEQWCFSDYHPDITVINLGTNDFASGADPDSFSRAYYEFLCFIHRFHPDCRLVCACGPIMDEPFSYIQKTADKYRAEIDKRISTLCFPLITESKEKGLDGHPSNLMHRKMADILIRHIREITEDMDRPLK